MEAGERLCSGFDVVLGENSPTGPSEQLTLSKAPRGRRNWVRSGQINVQSWWNEEDGGSGPRFRAESEGFDKTLILLSSNGFCCLKDQRKKCGFNFKTYTNSK